MKASHGQNPLGAVFVCSADPPGGSCLSLTLGAALSPQAWEDGQIALDQRRACPGPEQWDPPQREKRSVLLSEQVDLPNCNRTFTIPS